MGEGQVIQGITGGILAIVGILLAIISSGIWFRRVKIRIGFLGIGLALSGVGLFMLITSFPQYAIGFSVLATLALAFAAFLTIKEANEREERRREEDTRVRAEEIDRDFKRRCLKDIQDWAEKGISSLMEGVSKYGFIEEEKSLKVLASLRAMNKWMMDASRIFAKDDKKALLKKVDKAAEDLKQYCEVLEGKLSSEGIDQRYNQCLKSFTEVLERIADVKVKLKL